CWTARGTRSAYRRTPSLTFLLLPGYPDGGPIHDKGGTLDVGYRELQALPADLQFNHVVVTHADDAASLRSGDSCGLELHLLAHVASPVLDKAHRPLDTW